MIQEHQITPPPELVEQWLENTRSHDCIGAYPANYEQLICTQAARWGADQELEACCELMDEWELDQTDLRFARRPKPPSLKEQALEALENLNGECLLEGFECPEKVATIRRALESLSD